MKDYDFELTYHPGKANVVADALSSRSYVASLLPMQEWRLMADITDEYIESRGSREQLLWPVCQ